jgi:hypothetical protein
MMNFRTMKEQDRKAADKTAQELRDTREAA